MTAVAVGPSSAPSLSSKALLDGVWPTDLMDAWVIWSNRPLEAAPVMAARPVKVGPGKSPRELGR